MKYYEDLATGEIVAEEEAYSYVESLCKNDPQLRAEAREALVFWFFSGGMWVQKEE